MADSSRPTVWSRIYAISTWTLIVYFTLMAAIHVVLTVLFYLGVWDTGIGYVFDFDVPSWSIAVLDGVAAYALWLGYRRGADSPWLGLGLTVLASIIMIARALWFVVIPILVVVTISGSIRRVGVSRRPNQDHP